jgi:hypothetical protein
MNFSQGAGQTMGSELIPNGQLAWAILSIRGVKASKSGGQYLDVELTLEEGQPYGRKKIWDMIGDPMFSGNSEAYRQMGQVAIARILEAGRQAGPNNPGGYVIQSYDQLSGLRVAIKIGVKKGTGGYEDKNVVGEYLTPNPASKSGKAAYDKLMQGVFNTSPPQPTGFAPSQTPAQPAAGFGGAAQPGQAQTAPFGHAQPAPSNPGPGNWLAQANTHPATGSIDDDIPF